MNVFQVIDLFGKPIFLNFNGATRAKTHAGGVFSLLFFGFIIWSAYHVSQDLFEHANPQTLSSEFFSENPEQMILGPDTFTFGFGIQDPDTYAHYIDESVYTLNVIKNRLDNVMRSDGTVEQQWSSVNLETEICKTSHFGELADKFAGIELNQLFCFTPEQTGSGELRIQGVFESPVYEYISISITECNPAVRTCASEARRKALLEGGFFAIYFTNMAFDPKDYNQPSFRYRDSIYTTFGKNFFKEATMLLSHVQVTSDSGWVTREPQTKNFIKFESQRELFNLKSDLTDFFNFVIRVNKISEKHDRSYIKVQDIIAELNGLATIGLLAAFIIVSPYSNLKFYEGLINELFDIKMLKDLTQKLKQKQKKMLRKQMSLSHHIAQYIKPRSHDEDEDNMEKALEIMTPTKSPLKFDFDTGSPDLEEAKPEKEPRAHKEFNKKASFLRVTLEEGYNSPLAQYQQERQILANRNNNRKKTTTFHMGTIPEAITHSKVEAEPEEDIQRNNEVKAARGNLKKPSYYKAIMSDDINTLVVQTAEQQAREREASNSPKSRKKSSFNKPSIEHLHTPKSFKDKEGVKKQSFSKNSLPGNVNIPLADRQQQIGWEKDGESSKRTHKKSNAQKASITENLNTQPGDIDEYKDNRISSNLYSAELGKNPFSYKIEIKGREPELQQNHEMKRISSRGHGSLSSGRAHNKDVDQEGSAGLPGEKLQQDIPRAVKPSLRVMENERDMDSLDVILETIGLDNQQGGKESEEMERMQFTPGDMKSRSEVMDDDNKESREKADLVVSDQEGKNRGEEGSELRQEQLTTHAMLKVTDYDNIREPVGTVLNSYMENQQERSGADEENRVQLLTPSTDPKLNLVEYDNNREEVGIVVADRQESSGEGEHVKENTPSIRKDGVEMSVRKESKDAVRSRRLEDEDLISPSIVGIARNGGGKKTIVLREAHKLDLTFWEYIKSYVWKTAELKEKLSVLNEGRRRIDERLDIFNVFKKLREVDKLKLLLLENEQLVLFDGLPKPELKSKNCLDLEGSKSLSRHLLKDSRFISERRKQDLIAISYENLKEKPEITQIDQKLLDIYDDMAINT